MKNTKSHQQAQEPRPRMIRLGILVNQTLEIRRDAFYKKISKTVAVSYGIQMTDIANKKEKLAYNEYQKLVTLIRQQSNLFLELGFTLKRIRDDKLFKLVGDGGYETFGRFLAQPEIGIKPSTAFFYIQIYEEYVERLKLQAESLTDYPFYKLQRLLPVIRQELPEKAIEIIDELMPLGANDFNAEVRKLKGIDEVDTPPQAKRCEICNNWILLISDKDKCQGHDKHNSQ